MLNTPVIKVFIDGSAGTTGLRINERLRGLGGVEPLTLPEELRKDVSARTEAIAAADVAVLCLPDDAAREAAAIADSVGTAVIDASTAHRVAPGWAYGFPELSAAHRSAVETSDRVAVPGCHASGFVALVFPLIEAGVIPADAELTAFSLTGYSGGGKKMIAEYEGERTDERLSSCREYAIRLAHKHIPEMMAVTGLTRKPLFFPIVGDYYAGMTSTVGLHNDLLGEGVTAKTVHEYLSDYYAGQEFVRVLPFGGEGAIDPRGYLESNRNVGTNYLDIVVSGNEEQTLMAAMFDNLGKGASGAAVQNMELMLGMR